MCCTSQQNLQSPGWLVFRVSVMTISLVDGIELKDVKVQPNPGKGNFKDIEVKLEQLVCEVRKLQEQLVNISSQVNGTFAKNTTHI